MGRLLSTSLSDFVLAVAAWKSTIQAMPISLCGAAGFCLIGIAATMGSVRFFQAYPSNKLIQVHKLFSWISSFLGMSLLAAAYHKTDGSDTTSNVHLAASFTMLAMHPLLQKELCDQISDIMGGASLVSILGLSIIYFNPYGILGSSLFVVAALVIGTEGYIWKFPRVDLFHYVLVIAVIALTLGLTKQPLPVYYKEGT